MRYIGKWVSGVVSRLYSGLIVGICVWLGLCGISNAQTSTATVTGTVMDESGAIIPGAEVTLTNSDTGVERRTVSNSSGTHVLLNIPPGRYELQVSAEGFQTVKQSELTLAVNQTLTLDFTLRVGDVIEVVTVEGSAIEIQASTAELGAVVTTQAVVDLPLNGRNFTQLLRLTPGVSPISVAQNASGFASTTTAGSAFTFPSINGQNNRSNIYLLDGINNIGTFVNSYAVPPIIDGIREFKVQSHNDQAEFGGSLGGIVNVVTKSGTNEFHGALWEFLRNDALDARNTFLLDKTPFRQNQFGGSLGGPVILPKYHGRNKTFFYAALQGFRYRRPSDSLFRVPTAANLGGDLSDETRRIFNPFTTRADPSNPGQFVRDPFRNNQLPASVLDPGMVLFANTTLPNPVATGVADKNAIDSGSFTQDQLDQTYRVDQLVGSNDFFWLRYSRLDQGSDGSAGRAEVAGLGDQWATNWGVSYTHTFSPTTIIDVRYGEAFLEIDTLHRFRSVPPDFAQQIGFDPTFSTSRSGVPLTPSLNVHNFFSGGERDQRFTMSDINQVAANVSRIVGTHTFRWGGELSTNGYRGDSTINSVRFGTPQTSDPSRPEGTGSELASFLLNTPDSATKYDTPEDLRWGGVLGLYVQDQWRASQKLTVNIGLRYDRTYKPPFGTEKSPPSLYIGNYDLQRGVYVIQKMPPPCSQTGTAPCIPGGTLPENVELDPRGKFFFDDKTNFQPRLGLAYRMNDKTVLRASFGISFDNWAGVAENSQGILGSWPSIGLRTAQNMNNQLNTSVRPNRKATNPFPEGELPAPTPFEQQNWYIDPHQRQPYSLQWNFGIQRQLQDSTVLSANYVGSGSRKLVLGGFYNTALTPGPGDPRDRFPFPHITPTFYDRTWGRSNYHSFQFLLERRFGGGLGYMLSYTWSKAIDIGSSGWYGVEGQSVQDPYTFNNDRSVAGFDLPHIFALNWVYELPVGPGKRLDPTNRVLSHIIGNWQINGIVTLNSGTPFTLQVPGDLANTGNVRYLRPDYIGGEAELANPTPERWFNTDAFAAPRPFTFGSHGRHMLRSDGVSNMDFSVFRKFRVIEGHHLEFRVEMFNAFNSPVYARPNNNLLSNTFGVVTRTSNLPRQVQLGLKYVF